jgi:4'-phosphopantetheinyl transferase
MGAQRAMREHPLRAWLSARPRLRRDEVHVILVRLPPPGSVRGIPSVLDAEERRRTRRLAFATDRHRFAWSHAVLRAVLGRYLGRSAAAVRFAARAERVERPTLPPGARLRLGFSLSHAGDFAAVAVMRGATVGADVETPRPRLDPLAIARAYFAPSEIAALEACAPAARASMFLGLWTAKEAVLKALGTGLSGSLAEVELRLGDDGRPARVARAPGAVEVWAPAPIDAGVATLAVAAPRAIRRARFWLGAAPSLLLGGGHWLSSGPRSPAQGVS